MTKVLMVCLGNICRSPLAEGILRSKLSNKTFSIDSAGTANYHIGHTPDKRSIAVAKKYGLDSFNDIQVLSPMNRGIIGTRNLNLILQKVKFGLLF